MVCRFTTLAACGLACVGCVQDPKVEDELPPNTGMQQPEAGGTDTVSAADACKALADAEQAARSRVGSCDAPTGAPVCPDRVRVAGSLVCDRYLKSTVDACVAAVGGYEKCSDFDTKPCIVTAVEESCHAAGSPDAGDAGEGGAPDAAVPDASGSDAGIPDGGGDGATDGAALPDGAAVDGAADGAPKDAGPG